MNENTLKPCPFCGCEDIDEYEGEYGNGVYCMNCGAMMGEQIHREFHVHERVTYAQAAEAWNTRAERTCYRVTREHAMVDDAGREYTGTLEHCLACGEWMPYGARYCYGCGARVTGGDDEREA